MSWQIVETEIVGGQTRAFFWCDTSGCAFGPMMVDREAAEEVARRAGGDPRAVSLDALDHLYAGLIDEREYDPDPAPQPGEGGGEALTDLDEWEAVRDKWDVRYLTDPELHAWVDAVVSRAVELERDQLVRSFRRGRQRDGSEEGGVLGSCRICDRPTDGVTICRYCDRMMEATSQPGEGGGKPHPDDCTCGHTLEEHTPVDDLTPPRFACDVCDCVDFTDRPEVTGGDRPSTEGLEEAAHEHIETAVGDLCWIAEQLQGQHIKVSWVPDSEYVEEAIWECTQEIEEALRRLQAPDRRGGGG